MNVSLRQLRALVALVRTGSFTQAAVSLHVTQSALSSLIKELEQSLGVRLVERSTRSIGLTEAGRGFVPLIDKILQDLDGVLGGIDDLKALRRGVVRVAAPQLMACTLMPEVIAAYRREHPGVQVRLSDCAVDGVLARVAAGEADFGVGPERGMGGDMAGETLFEMPFMVVFPSDHPLAELPRICWSDAITHPFIALQGQFAERLSLDLHGALREITLNPSNEVTFMTTALSMVSAGLGITACLPYASSLVRLYQLRLAPLHEPQVLRKFLVYQRSAATLSPAAQSFREFLLAYVASHHWGVAGDPTALPTQVSDRHKP
ncbi:MAG: LysR family transcriptional regulator [Burkholderiales bacterium]|jgi:DNA-binding transcriptional LysR family regulator|nr:LysR family transcriptional regulator [Burkholderiales bacterium]